MDGHFFLSWMLVFAPQKNSMLVAVSLVFNFLNSNAEFLILKVLLLYLLTRFFVKTGHLYTAKAGLMIFCENK